jgi:hypothetical protein
MAGDIFKGAVVVIELRCSSVQRLSMSLWWRSSSRWIPSTKS